MEEAAASLGAGPLTVLRRIVLPTLDARDRLRDRAELRARGRRVRLARADHGQPAVQDGGRLGVRLRPDPERKPAGRGGRVGRAAAAALSCWRADSSRAESRMSFSGQVAPVRSAGQRRRARRARPSVRALGLRTRRARLPRAAAAGAGGDDLLPHLRTRPRARVGRDHGAERRARVLAVDRDRRDRGAAEHGVRDRHGAAARARARSAARRCWGC